MKISPEFRAQSNGVVLGMAAGWLICWITNLSAPVFFLLTILSMGIMGLVFAARDAWLASAGKPAVGLRVLFWRGVSEAILGFALLLIFVLLRKTP